MGVDVSRNLHCFLFILISRKDIRLYAGDIDRECMDEGKNHLRMKKKAAKNITYQV